ncbi:replicative DNA helicase [Aerosakkonemataceae cyanobacterium BLCC-F50]|uniref:Replicative DNA helicase n=1 Tax=Floridaenema flaviceps BLCC-F50 TaxID=3153642 RepID=A0ABV4XXA9_9CYAN
MVDSINFQSVGDRLPPQNIEAEESILGGILIDPEAINRVADLLTSESFSLEAHKIIYRATSTLHSQGKPTDLLTVMAWLADHKLLDKIGGQSKLVQLVDRTVSAVNIDQYAKLIVDKYLRRKLIHVGHEIAQLGYDTAKELPIILDEAEEKVFGITQERPQQGLVSISETLIHTFQELEIRNQELTLPGLTCDFYDLDAMTGGFQRSDLIIVAGRPSMGKCCSADSEILLADGRVVTIQDIYNTRNAKLLTLGKDGKFYFTQPSAFVDDGIKPVFRVTTRLGRSIETTITHPYLTINGWCPLAELKPGVKIAVPRQLNVFGQERLSEEKIKLLAYLIGNAHDKIIPGIVFQLERSQLALFLNRLFATDGWATVLASGQSQLGYCTVSEKMARQIQHLLLRFGIIATLKKRSVKYKDSRRQAWQLDITDAQSIKTFIAEISIFGKEKALLKVQQALVSKRYQTNKDLIPKEIWQQIAVAKGSESWQHLAQRAGIKGYSNIHVGKRALSREKLFKLALALENLPLQQLATSEIYWDEIVSIESVGYKQVYDLTIPETHNFLANDICVHNTSFALGIAYQIARLHKLPIAVFSLEMSKEQLVQRMLSGEAEIESNRLRSGRISQNEWDFLNRALGVLTELPIYIDDSANITVTEMKSQARRLQAEIGSELGLILIDYLQLMEGGGDNRVQELSKITRSLKGLARELNVPVIALSQLSRGVEARTNKRPMMADLRESGCLTGDTLVTLADSGVQVPICSLVGKSGFNVWALNQTTMKLEKAIVSNAFSTGIKPVLKLTTRLGRTIKATGNHKFLTINGWQRLDQLEVGSRIALPRSLASPSQQLMTNSELGLLGHLIGDGCTLPNHAIQYTTREEDLANTVVSLAIEVFGDLIKPRIVKERNWYQVYLAASYHLTHKIRNPLVEWLNTMGVFGLRSYEKFIPNEVFEQPQTAISIFLRHLWSTDGCIRPVQGKSSYPNVYYTSSSERLSRDVQSLLLRLGINARLSVVPQLNKGRDQYQVWVTGRPDLESFVELVGAVGKYKQQSLREIGNYIQVRTANTNRDIIPNDIWRMYAVPAMQQYGLTTRQTQTLLGNKYCGTTLYKQNLSRTRADKLALIVKSDEIKRLATSDVYWDEIISIEADGEAEVYDLTVPYFHNFIANNIVVHNSIEQDADLVIMLYRDEYYNPDTPDRGVAEIIITKHRNGPTGAIKLLFDPQFTRFRNMASPHRG